MQTALSDPFLRTAIGGVNEPDGIGATCPAVRVSSPQTGFSFGIASQDCSPPWQGPFPFAVSESDASKRELKGILNKPGSARRPQLQGYACQTATIQTQVNYKNDSLSCRFKASNL